MKNKSRYFVVPVFLVFCLILACGESSSTVSNEMDQVEEKIVSEITGTSNRESQELEKLSELTDTADDLNFDDYSLVIKDNEYYYYCLNRKKSYSNRHYVGKVYYYKDTPKYRGECIAINGEDKSFSIYYIDPRYNSMLLVTSYLRTTALNESNYGTIYFHHKGWVWLLRMEFWKGTL